MKPTIGRIVTYRLTEEQAAAINKRRSDFATLGREKLKDDSWSFGAQAHVGNAVQGGECYPLIITRVWPGSDSVNGQVLLDGTDALWVTSATECSDGPESTMPAPGHWMWPARA